ncbi:MAG: metallophosphoesterase [Deltaproteobacteria bacterium]|nr:metallophosphoesterase [Deltaproteobacteria bacterium]
MSDKTEEELKYVLEFMDKVLFDADYVFILGDMFEFYHGYEGYIYEHFLPFAKKLKELSEKGKKIFFLEGNHEFSLGSFFESVTSSKSMLRLDMKLDSLRIYISHGHEMTPSFLNYLLRSKFMLKIMDLLGPRISWKLAMLASVFLSNKKKVYKGKTLKIFREYAERKLKEGFDVVILAHSHIPDRYEIVCGSTRKLYLNTGDIVRDSTYIEYTTETGFSLRKYP